MIQVGAYEVKTHLSEYLNKVKSGEKIVITKHHHPIARIVPMNNFPSQTVAETVQALKSFRKGKKLGRLGIKKLINEGRR